MAIAEALSRRSLDSLSLPQKAGGCIHRRFVGGLYSSRDEGSTSYDMYIAIYLCKYSWFPGVALIFPRMLWYLNNKLVGGDSYLQPATLSEGSVDDQLHMHAITLCRPREGFRWKVNTDGRGSFETLAAPCWMAQRKKNVAICDTFWLATT